MADYLPHREDGPITSTASATITAGQVVAITGADTVGPAGAASAAWLGVAAFDVVSGQKVTLFVEGVQLVTASGSIAAGDSVVCGAAGTVATATTPASDVFVGKALTAATNGNPVKVRFVR